MNPEQWRQLKPILQEALYLEPSERVAFLAECEPALRAEVEIYIRSYEDSSGFLEQPIAGIPGAPVETTPALAGRRFGPYRALSLLGHGGMGTVWLAERADGLFTRRVALKLIHPALAGWVMNERLAREREILAGLSHPNIARLFDAGFAEDGQPYLALEFVDGTPLTTHCDTHQLGIRQRLELFLQVMDAVQHAHAHLIVHRDLKPSNVLVTSAGQVHLLDFGIAKLLTDGEARETELTLLGGRALTPDYAAPEQITGALITTSTDVYALGVMLHEVLTGERPYRLQHESRGALEDAILKAEPTTPSRVTVSADAARVRATTPKQLVNTLKGDLDVILSKALKKKPAERYATVNAFAEDVQRFLRREPLLAQRDSIAYRAGKFVRRHWVALSVAGALVLTLVAGLLATMHEATVASRLRDVALQAQLRSLTQIAAARLKDNNVAGALGVILQVLPSRGAQRPYTPEALSVLQEARAADRQLLAITGHSDTVEYVAFSPDGRKIVSASDDRTARVWDPATGQQLLMMKHAGRITRAAFSPDGTKIITASTDKTVRIWNAATGELSRELKGHTAGVWSASFSPDGHRILTSSSDKTARIWDASSGQQILLLSGHTDRVWSAAFSPDGRQVVTASFDKSARVWDAVTGRQLMELSGHTDPVSSAKYSPDGTRIVTSSFDHTARIWDARTGEQRLVLRGHTDQLMSAAYSADGARIITASMDKSSRVWDAATGAQIMVFGGYGARINSAALSPDGRQVAVASYDGNVYVWNTSVQQERLNITGHAGLVWSAAYSPDGRRIVTASLDRTARIWDAITGQALLTLSGHQNNVPSAFFSPDGQHVLTGSNDGTAAIWNSATGGKVLEVKCPARVWTAAYSPDGRLFATASDDGTAQVWDAATGKQTNTLRGHTARVVYVLFSPDGHQIVTTSGDKTARVWDSATGRNLMQLTGHEDVVESAGYSPDGRRIATASDDKTVRIWDASTGAELMQLNGHEDIVQSVAFSADNKRIVTASADKTVRIWDASTGREIKLIGGFAELVASAAFSPNGRDVLTAAGSTAGIWDAGAPPLDVQIDWAEASQFDPLSSQEIYRLGVVHDAEVREWPHASKCDQAAASADDPDRRSPGVALEEIVPETALAACAGWAHDAGRMFYQHGRAALANHDSTTAVHDFEEAAAHGYRVARLDLAAALLAGPSGGVVPVDRVISLYQQAWKDGVAVAAFKLGTLYEHGLGGDGKQPFATDVAKASSWYESGLRAGEPNAVAYFAASASRAALSESEVSGRDARLLEAFKYYTAAAERARREDWPDAMWKQWRYHRASIARVLAQDGMTEQVAKVYRTTRTGALLP